MQRHILLVSVLVMALAGAALAQTGAGRRAEVEQSLRQRYRLAEVGPGMLGLTGSEQSLRRPGGVLVLRRGDLYGSLDRGLPASWNIREGAAEMFRGQKDFGLAAGEKLYVHSVFVGSDVVALGLVSVRVVSASKGEGRLWLAMNFFFPSAILATGDAGAIYRTLDEWLLPEEGLRPVVTEAVAPAALPVSPPVVPPAELRPGMTREEVLALLGAPQREVSFGSRSWLSYSGMVVLLEAGKLVSVDRSGQPPAKVNLVSEPDGAELFLDGSFVGSTPATLELPAGTYKLSARLPGYRDWERELRVLPGSEITVRARLEK